MKLLEVEGARVSVHHSWRATPLLTIELSVCSLDSVYAERMFLGPIGCVFAKFVDVIYNR